jgi:hypothetical protein
MGGKATQRVNLAAVWDRDQEEPWLLITNLSEAEKVREIYSNRFRKVDPKIRL